MCVRVRLGHKFPRNPIGVCRAILRVNKIRESRLTAKSKLNDLDGLLISWKLSELFYGYFREQRKRRRIPNKSSPRVFGCFLFSCHGLYCHMHVPLWTLVAAVRVTRGRRNACLDSDRDLPPAEIGPLLSAGLRCSGRHPATVPTSQPSSAQI